jgi:O-antigen/teichoic acid export membrane protein
LASPAARSGPLSAADEASRGSAIKLGAELVGRLLALATTLLVARMLGVADFGLFAVLSGIAVILAELSDLGLQGIAVPALVSGRLPLSSLVRAKAPLTAGLVLAAGASAALPQALAWSAAAAPDAWRASWEAALRRVPLLFPLVLYSAMASWSELLGIALRVRGRRALEAAIIVTFRASGLVLVAVALWSGLGLTGLVWATAASAVPPIALAAVLLARTGSPAGDGGGPIEAGVGRTLRASSPLAVNGVLAIVSLRIELLLLALFRGSREAGLFAAALKVVELMNVVPAAVAAGAMPALTREAARGADPVRRRTAATVALLAAPAAAGLVLVAPGIVSLLGEGYAAAATPLRVLAPALIALFMNTVLMHALIAAGRTGRLPALTGARVAAAAALALVLIPRLGAAGAAAGFLVSEVLLLVLAARACARASVRVPVARSVAAALAVTVPMVAAVALAGAGTIASVAVGVVTYGVTLLAARRLAPRLIPGLASEAAPGSR